MTPELKALAEQAGIHVDDALGVLKPVDPADLEEFGRLVAADCANVKPNDLNILASDHPHQVWVAFRDAIRTKYGAPE